MDDFYKIAIPQDIPIKNRDNICSFFNQTKLYEAHIDQDSLALKKTSWPDFYQLKGSITISTDRIALSKIVDDAFSWGPIPTVDENAARVVSAKRSTLQRDVNGLDLVGLVSSIKDILALSGKTVLLESLEMIKEVFLNRFPKGEILYIHTPSALSVLARAPSMLSGLQYLSADDLEALASSNQGKGMFNTFQKGHFLLARDFLAAGLHDLEGGSYGFSSHWLTHQFVFLFGKRMFFEDKTRQAKLQSAYGIDGLNEMWSDKSADIPVAKELTPTQAKEYYIWYIRGINKTLSFLLNSTNFRSKHSGEIMIKDQLYSLMTFDAMTEIVLRCCVNGNNLTRKLLFFDFLDRYAGLLGHTGSSSAFNNAYFTKRVLNKYIGLSGNLRQLLQKNARKDYARLFGETLSGVYQRDRQTRGYVHMGRDRKTKVSSQGYFEAFMANLRDTTHGYPLKSGKFTNFFAIHTGRISHLLPRMAVYLFHGLISDPESSLKRRCAALSGD